MIGMDFPAIYLLHGMGGSPNGSVKQLEAELLSMGQQLNYVRPEMPHADPAVAASTSVQHLRDLNLPQGTLIVGISMGGLVAAKLQETGRADLHVICINSPTWAGDIELHRRMNHRVSFYCSGNATPRDSRGEPLNERERERDSRRNFRPRFDWKRIALRSSSHRGMAQKER